MTQMTRLHAAAAVLVIVTSVAPAAQRGRRGGGNANAGLPLATNAILRNPEVYYGKQITVSAGVDRMASKTAFVVDQWKMTGGQAYSSNVTVQGCPASVRLRGRPGPRDVVHSACCIEHKAFTIGRYLAAVLEQSLVDCSAGATPTRCPPRNDKCLMQHAIC